MTDSSLLQWIHANPEWAGLATFIISAGESVAIIGTIVPGSITMTAIGILAGAGVIPLWSTIFWAMVGAIVGDGISYWMGYYFKDSLKRSWPFIKNPTILIKGEDFVHRYGLMSVFIGRFIGPIRAIVPLVAGMLGMRPLLFTLANVTSAIGWAPAYMLPGILVGAASLELPPDIAVHVMIILLLILLLISLGIWFLYKILLLISSRIDQWLNRVWNNLSQSRYFHIWTVLLKHHNPAKHHGQLVLAFYLTLASIILIILLTYVHMFGANSISSNQIVYHFFSGIRSIKFDHALFYITLLGQKEILLPVAMCIFLYFALIGRMRLALHLLALVVLTFGGAYVLKTAMHITRPDGLAQALHGFSMPSGHTALSTTLWLGFALLLGRQFNKPTRIIIYNVTLFIIFLVGISRLYLGAHWFTDVIAGWLLSTVILMFIVLSYNREEESNIAILPTLFVFFISFGIAYLTYLHLNFTKLTTLYARKIPIVQTINEQEWWEKDNLLPSLHVNLFGFTSQVINVQWAGQFADIRATLLKNGWHEPPPRDWISTLHRISDVNSTEYLPMISPHYLDQKPALILVKKINDNKKLLVLRLWNASLQLQPSKLPLWVGTIGWVPRSYHWLFKKHQKIEADPLLIVKTEPISKNWQYKVILIPIQNKKSSFRQKILLIRP